MMPSMARVIQIFEETLQFQIVKKTVVDGDLAESSQVLPTLWFEGALQPIHATQLKVKPEGQRSWSWWTLYTDMDLQVDWIIKDQEGKTYRVMVTNNWRGAGYSQYELTEGPNV